MSSETRADQALPWTLTEGGLRVLVRLTPRAGRDGLDGIETLSDGRGALKARVRAVPQKGRANEALARLLADQLGLPAASIIIAAGATSRLKAVLLAGESQTLAKALAAALAQSERRTTNGTGRRTKADAF